MADKPLLLVIDDEDALRSHLSDILRSDFRVIGAASARQGTELLGLNTFDAILVDVVMPGTNGISFCKEMRERMNETTVPIIMISALKRARDAHPVL